MVYISQEAIDEIAAMAGERRPKKRTFELVIDTGTVAFGDDAWDREMEVARILRTVSEALYGNAVESNSARLRDRNGALVGYYEFKED